MWPNSLDEESNAVRGELKAFVFVGSHHRVKQKRVVCLRFCE